MSKASNLVMARKEISFFLIIKIQLISFFSRLNKMLHMNIFSTYQNEW